MTLTSTVTEKWMTEVARRKAEAAKEKGNKFAVYLDTHIYTREVQGQLQVLEESNSVCIHICMPLNLVSIS